MSAQDNATIYRESVEAFNNRDWDKALSLVTEDSVIVDDPTGHVYHGHAGWMEFLQNAAKAFPDCQITITNLIADEKGVASECTFRGTHTGSLPMPQGELVPTGRSIQVHAAGFFSITSGKIVAYHRYSDVLIFLQQLGLAPQPEKATV